MDLKFRRKKYPEIRVWESLKCNGVFIIWVGHFTIDIS